MHADEFLPWRGLQSGSRDKPVRACVLKTLGWAQAAHMQLRENVQLTQYRGTEGSEIKGKIYRYGFSQENFLKRTWSGPQRKHKMEVLRGKAFMNRRGHSWQGNCRSKCPGAGLSVECEMSGLAGAPDGDERGAVLSFSALNSGPLARWSPRGLLPWAASPGGIFPLLWAGKKFSHLLIAMWPFKEKTIRDADLWALERREGRKKFSPEGRGRVGNIQKSNW